MRSAVDEREQVARAAALVLRAIKRVGADGRPVYSEEQITHAIPWIAFTMGADVRSLSARVQTIIVRFMVAMNLPLSATPEAVRTAIDDFYEQHPIAPGLMADVSAAFRAGVVELSSSRAGEDQRREALSSSHAPRFRAVLQLATEQK